MRKLNMRLLMLALLCGVFVVALSAPIQADIIAQHVGSTDPVTEGFEQMFSGAGPATDPDNGGVPVWNVPSSGTRYYHYVFSDATVASMMSTGWVATETVRPNLYPFDDSHYGVNLELSMDPGDATGTRTYTLEVGTDSSNHATLCYLNNITIDGSVTQIPLTGVTGVGALHTYELRCPNPAVSDAAQVYVDGIYQTTVAAMTGSNTVPGLSRLNWGSSSGGAGPSADVYWSGVTLSTIPEPSSIALLATGLLSLLAYAWRKRK
jgi:hypothetical protein